MRARIEARLAAGLAAGLGGWARLLPARRAMALLGLDALEPAYRRARLGLAAAEAEGRAPGFEAALLEALGVDWRLEGGRAGDIPATGPVMVVANHPTGGVEGLILAAIVDARRRDRLALGNAAVGLLPEIGARQIGVDNRARRGNLAAMRRARAHLGQGGALTTFPAGTVAHFSWSRGRVVEAPWHPGIARLAIDAGAALVPIRFEARAGLLWHLATPFSRAARSALLARTLLAQRGARVGVSIGRPLYDAESIRRHFAAHD